jgi:ribose transport system permease protein/erythritol transport system permease protein
MILLKMRTIIALILLVIVFTVLLNTTRGINFLHPVNLMTIAKHVAITGIMAIGMTFVILLVVLIYLWVRLSGSLE